MTTHFATESATASTARHSGLPSRAQRLADRLEQGAAALGRQALLLTDEQWQRPIPGDGRTIGVVVHHVASVYPIEIELATRVAAGEAITGVTAADIDQMNATHARQHAAVTCEHTLTLLRANSAAAAAAIRAMSDEALDRAAAVSLYDDAIVTSQFVLEDHAVRHSLHHLAAIRRALDSRS